MNKEEAMRGSPGSQASTHSAGVELRPFIMRANRIAIMTRDKLNTQGFLSLLLTYQLQRRTFSQSSLKLQPAP